jgi:signal transduction histidine kinase
MRCTSLHVSVVEGQRRATLSVTDDGRGFGPARAGAGFGLVGMRERVRSLGGDLWIESEPGRGTSVRAEVPLTTTAEHERNSAGGTRRHPLAEGAR